MQKEQSWIDSNSLLKIENRRRVTQTVQELSYFGQNKNNYNLAYVIKCESEWQPDRENTIRHL